MIIAFLFNWRAYSEAGNYWHEIRDAVFAPGIIQRSGRHMKLSIGDVLVGLERGQDLRPSSWQLSLTASGPPCMWSA